MQFCVIIPVWNQPEYLDMALQSLREQYLTPHQIIVVDDASDREFEEEHKAIAEHYKAFYIFDDHRPKAMRRAECFKVGLDYVGTDAVAFFDADMIYDPKYTADCFSVLQRYDNLVIFHACFHLPFPSEVRRQLEYGVELKDMNIFRDTDYPYHGGYTGRETWWSTIDNIHPTEGTTGCDGNCIVRTGYARQYDLWDPNVVNKGTSFDFAMSCLASGLVPVVIRDIISYHLRHHKPLDRLSKPNDENSRYKAEKWHGVSIEAPSLRCI